MAKDSTAEMNVDQRLARLSPERRKLLDRLSNGRQEKHSSVTAIPRRLPSNSAPLTYAQQRMWFLDRLYPGTAALNCDFAVRVQAPYDLSVLERALNEIVCRHEILRTTFRDVDGETVQVIEPSLRIPLPVVELSTLSTAEREAEALRLSTLEACEPFNLTQGPLLRAKLLKLGESDYILLITMHHIIADYFSMLVFFNELKSLYLAYSVHLPSPLSELPIQYADFAVWQRNQFQTGQLREQLEYWKRQLQDAPKLRLPTDRPRSAVAIWEGARYIVDLSRELLSAIRTLSQRNDCTPFMTLLAGFQALLYRYTGQEDVLVGVPIANRTRPGTERLIGFFVNSLVMRTRVTGDLSFRELLSRVRKTALEAFSNQDVPFEQLVEELHPERDASQHPLFQVSFQSLPVPASSPVASRMGIERGTSTIDLAVEIEERPEAPVLRFEYSTSLFDEPTIVRMARHFRKLLEGIVANPDQRIGDVPMLSATEYKQLLVDWNDTAADYARTSCIHELFEQQVRRTPDALALVCGEQLLTYRQVDQRANEIAHHLRSRGVGADHLVALCLDRSVDLVLAILGILKAGGAYVPLDPEYPKERLAYLLKDSGVIVLITSQRWMHHLPAHSVNVVCLDQIDGNTPNGPLGGVVESDNLAYVIYTSGSTGAPKGVAVEHRSVCNNLLWMQRQFPLTPIDRVPLKYSASFDVSVWEIFGPLIAGGRLVVAPPGIQRDPDLFIRFLVEHEITVLDLVPSLLRALLENPRFRSCRSLRHVTCGGEPFAPDLRDLFFDQFDLELNNMYGPTEATITASWWTCGRTDPAHTVPIGRPIANTQLYVLDSHGNPVPIGVPGELYISGECLARGYLNRPEMTRQKFVRNPFSSQPGTRLYKTGDLVRWLPEGALEYLGRVDEQVKVRGYRIEPGEIEALLAEHESVRACAVLPHDSENEDTRLVAYVVPTTGEPELWPSVGEYFVYDELLYYAMTTDEARNRAYRAAIDALAEDKTVVDIGTGADVILARLCVEAGAERVYAIEMIDSAFEQAQALVARLGLEDKIVVIHGDSTTVMLPEKVDVCVSELIGTIGSSEGVIPLLNDAWRFLKDGGAMIPRRSITMIAAVSLPDHLALRPRFTQLSAHYAEDVFKKVGYPFDVRVCIKNLPRSSVISGSDIFEDLEFQDTVQLESERKILLTIGRDCRLDGFLLWLNLYPAEQVLIDVWNDQYSWLPVFFPAFSPGIEVRRGDVIEAVCERVTQENRWTPDYRIKGIVRRQSRDPIEFCYESLYDKPSFKQNAFYQALFSNSVRSGPVEISSADDRQVTLWHEEYDHLYNSSTDPEDPTFNVVGWDSTYTGLPIPAEDMREQVEASVGRVLNLRPKRILEIGCGTGLLLFRLVSYVTRYVGTDFSRAALDYVSRHVPAAERERLTLLERPADNFGGLEPASFDMVILNSVVQYFPTTGYLTRVLAGAMRMVAPGGYIFIGDVRSLPLLEAFHTSVELSRADALISSAELRDRVRQRMSHERELVIAPGFFTALGRRIPPFGQAQVMLKRGWHENELTRFRYDVLMQIGVRVRSEVKPAALPWESAGDIDALVSTLRRERPEVLMVSDIPNRRLRPDLKAVELLRDPNGPGTVKMLRAAVDALEPGIEPEQFWALEKELPYRVHITWAAHGSLDRFDVYFSRNGCDGPFEVLADVKEADERPLNDFANSPGEQSSAEELGSVLRSFLRGLLPEYMIPADFIQLQKLPFTPSGKVDRKALLESSWRRSAREYGFVAPRTELERSIAAAWKAVLRTDQVGLHDNFFDLGGHSLLLVRLQTKLHESVGPNLTITDLFRFPTVGALAAHLATSSSSVVGRSDTLGFES